VKSGATVASSQPWHFTFTIHTAVNTLSGTRSRQGNIDLANSPHRKTIRHYDGEGDARELTFSCYQRRPFFTREHVCEWFLEALKATRTKHGIHVWAYVIMPEHAHVLVWPPTRECKISKVLNTLKGSVAQKAYRYLLRTDPDLIRNAPDGFHFWQAGPGYDRNLNEPKSIWSSIDYIHMNPVRRGLCLRPEDWRWSSARAYLCNEADDLLNLKSLPEDPR